LSARIGFVVIETCQDYEQILGLKKMKNAPPLGILNWTNSVRSVFKSRNEAKAAIDRTEHFRLAWGRTDLPEKKFCKIIPVGFALPVEAP
jgi:hypothetical protein